MLTHQVSGLLVRLQMLTLLENSRTEHLSLFSRMETIVGARIGHYTIQMTKNKGLMQIRYDWVKSLR